MRDEEDAYCLLDIFIIFYALNVLQSDNGCEFRNQTIDSLKYIWSELTIIHVKPHLSLFQRSVEREH